jgi:hypothetical protein
MDKLRSRVELLEAAFQASFQPEPSIWLRKAVESLTDYELSNGKRYLELAMAGQEEEATPEETAAIRKLWRLEEELEEAAVRCGEPLSDSAQLTRRGIP